jgi:hypothetical protein
MRPQRARDLLLALVFFLLHAAAREADQALGALLHTSRDVPSLLFHLPQAFAPGAVVRIAAWLAAGVLAASWVAWVEAERPAAARGVAAAFAPLLLRCVITVLALASVALRPRYPYACTLPVALTQDLGPAQDAASLAAFLAARPWASFAFLGKLRAPSPRTLGVVAFLLFAAFVPPSMRRYDGHTGNEPKTLRMAVTLGLRGSLDVEGIDQPMEQIAARPLAANLRTAAASLGRETPAMLRAALPGGAGLGRDALAARRLSRQTVTGKEGGAFHVLAPGPSLLLAPLLRADRSLNLARGTPGGLALSLCAWFALSALIVSLMQRTLRELGAGAVAAALAAALGALLPPLVFFWYQFYPEGLGALAFLWIARRLFLSGRLDDARSGGVLWPLAFVIAATPWLHQKFLAVWVALIVVAVGKAVHDLVSWRALATLLWPQALSAFAYALYNFAITGSARPDALFLAWGPGGISSERLGLGLLGLLFDARYGLLPYAPFFLLAPAGVVLLWRRRSPVVFMLFPAAVYFVTVASANNWAGSICNLGRFMLVLVPLLVVAAGVVLAHVAKNSGRVAVCVALALWSLLFAYRLWHDPAGLNDCALFLRGSAYADGNVYIPNLWLPGWSSATPGLFVRLAAWLAATVALSAWLVQPSNGAPSSRRPSRAMAAFLGVLLALAFILERTGSYRASPIYEDALALGDADPATDVVFIEGAGITVHRGENALAPAGGEVRFLVRSRQPLAQLPLLAFGDGHAASRAGYAQLRPAGVPLNVPLDPFAVLRDRDGTEETLARGALRLHTASAVSLEVRR